MKSWIDVLREESQKPGKSQAKVAKELKVSPATISLILKESYTGDVDRIETLVRGKFMKETVMCPIMAAISKDRCLEEQSKPFSAHNPMRAKLYKACKNCIHNKNKGK